MQYRTAHITQVLTAPPPKEPPNTGLSGLLPTAYAHPDGARRSADGQPGSPAGVDPAAEARLWWPEASVWYGSATGVWWAFLPGGPDRLLDSPDPAELIRAIAHLRKSRTHP